MRDTSEAILFRALKFAMGFHEGQTRDDKMTPYIVHPIMVSYIGRDNNYDRILALLHDTVEDTSATLEDIREYFDEQTTKDVASLTVPEGLTGEEKHQYILNSLSSASENAKAVKMADRIDNLCSSEHWNQKRRIKYAKKGLEIAEVCKSASKYLYQTLTSICNSIIEEK